MNAFPLLPCLLASLLGTLPSAGARWAVRPPERCDPGSLAARHGEGLLVSARTSRPLPRLWLKAPLPLDSARKALLQALGPLGEVQDSLCPLRWSDLGPQLRSAFLSRHPTLRKDWAEHSLSPELDMARRLGTVLDQDTAALVAAAVQELIQDRSSRATPIRSLFDSLHLKGTVLTLTRSRDAFGDDRSLVRIVALDAGSLFGTPTTLLSLQRIDRWRPPLQGFLARLWRRFLALFRSAEVLRSATLVSPAELDPIVRSLAARHAPVESAAQVSAWFPPLRGFPPAPSFAPPPDSLPGLGSERFPLPPVAIRQGSKEALRPRSMLSLPQGQLLLAGNVQFWERGEPRPGWALLRCGLAGPRLACRTLALWDRRLQSLGLEAGPEGLVTVRVTDSGASFPRQCLLRPGDPRLDEEATGFVPPPRTSWKPFHSQAVSRLRSDRAGIEAIYPLPPGTGVGPGSVALELPGTGEAVLSFSSPMLESSGLLSPRLSLPHAPVGNDSGPYAGIHFLDLRSKRIRCSRLLLKGDAPSCIARSPGGRWIAVLQAGMPASPAQILLVEVRTGLPRYRLRVRSEDAQGLLTFSWDGKELWLPGGSFETRLERWALPEALVDPATRGTFPDRSQALEVPPWREIPAAPQEGPFQD